MVMLCDKVDKDKLPQFLAVTGTDWVAETKEDGDRIRLELSNGVVRLSNRRMRSVTETYPEMHNFKVEGINQIFLDGEMCVFRDGISQFNEGITFRSHCKSPSSVASAMSSYPVTYVVFDILELNGEDLRYKPLKERRKILEGVGITHPSIKIAEQFTDIQDAWNVVEKTGAEGLILKHTGSLYKEGYRSSNWKKVKNIKEIDLKFTKYDVNPKGITVENSDGHRCLVAGRHQHRVKELIDKNKMATVTIRHLGQTKVGRYRQPVFMKVVED